MSSHAMAQTKICCRSPPRPMFKRGKYDRCCFEADGFDENLVHDILSRLPLLDLLAAKQCCRSWRDIISTCKKFHALYDRQNKDAMVIGLNSSTNSFPFFQISKNGRKHMRQWNMALDPSIVGEKSEWMFVGSSKSLLLFAEKEGIKFCVANPLTRKCRLIIEPPNDSMVNNSMKMKSVEMIVSGSDNSLSLLVFAFSFPPYAYFSMVYNSLTNAWKVCNLSQISRRSKHFGTIIEGACFNGQKAIQFACSSFHACSLISYDTETSLLAEQDIRFVDTLPKKYRFRATGVGIFEYQNNMYLLDAYSLFNRAMSKMTEIRIWEADSSGGVWMLFIHIDLVADFGSPISCHSVVCYDQERYISVFPRAGSRMILVDLHSKSFRILRANPVTLNKNKNINYSGYYRNCLRAFPIKPSFNCFL